MQTLGDIKRLLAEHGLSPRRRFGQNFLHDQNLLRRLVDASGVREGDLVLEVGPGTGTLTEALVDRGAEVLAVEIDRDLAALVASRLGDRMVLIQGDCLGSKRRLAEEVRSALGGRPFKLVANLPYEIASPLMAELMLGHPECLGQWVTVQREVADRLTADPGTRAWGPLGVIIRSGADVSRVATLPPTCFWPAPKVTSAMVAIERRPGVSVDRDYAAFITRLFASRRKQLGGVLGKQIVARAGIEPTLRCERLDVAAFERLFAEVCADGKSG